MLSFRCFSLSVKTFNASLLVGLIFSSSALLDLILLTALRLGTNFLTTLLNVISILHISIVGKIPVFGFTICAIRLVAYSITLTLDITLRLGVPIPKQIYILRFLYPIQRLLAMHAVWLPSFLKCLVKLLF